MAVQPPLSAGHRFFELVAAAAAAAAEPSRPLPSAAPTPAPPGAAAPAAFLQMRIGLLKPARGAFFPVRFSPPSPAASPAAPPAPPPSAVAAAAAAPGSSPPPSSPSASARPFIAACTSSTLEKPICSIRTSRKCSGRSLSDWKIFTVSGGICGRSDRTRLSATRAGGRRRGSTKAPGAASLLTFCFRNACRYDDQGCGSSTNTPPGERHSNTRRKSLRSPSSPLLTCTLFFFLATGPAASRQRQPARRAPQRATRRAAAARASVDDGGIGDARHLLTLRQSTASYEPPGIRMLTKSPRLERRIQDADSQRGSKSRGRERPRGEDACGSRGAPLLRA